MKVKCKKIINSSEDALILGKEYVVLEVLEGEDTETEYRILSKHESVPCLQKASQFEVIDRKEPSSWVYRVNDYGLKIKSPERWNKVGFWVNYFNHEAEAIEIYEYELKKIIDELN